MLSSAQLFHRLKIASKIPFMADLSAGQIERVLQAGKMISIDGEKLVCKAGDNSNSLWILLAGELDILKGEILLTTIESVEIVGEMGVITGLSRSATIKAKRDVVLLEIQKLRLDKLMKDDIDLERKLYRNMLRSLCEKLRSTSSQLAEGATKTDREIMASLA